MCIHNFLCHFGSFRLFKVLLLCFSLGALYQLPTIQHLALPWPRWLRTFINIFLFLPLFTSYSTHLAEVKRNHARTLNHARRLVIDENYNFNTWQPLKVKGPMISDIFLPLFLFCWWWNCWRLILCQSTNWWKVLYGWEWGKKAGREREKLMWEQRPSRWK